MTAKVTELLQVLADRGMNDDAIVNVRDGLWAQANEAFMDEVLSSLTNEDLEQVEASGTQEEANEKFVTLYKEKTGKDMQEEMNRIVDQYATDLIAKYKVEEPDPVVSYGPDPVSQASLEDNAVEAIAGTPATSVTTDEGKVPEVGDKKKEEDTIHDLT